MRNNSTQRQGDFTVEATARNEAGFTFIELFITLAIAAIVVAFAVPAVTDVIRRVELTSNTDQLVTALNLARNESIKRGERVVVRRTGANWENGWSLFVDMNQDDDFDDDGDGILCEGGEDCVLQVYDPLPGSYTLRAGDEGGNAVDFVRYRSNGLSNGALVLFALCDNQDGNNLPEANTARLIMVTSVGRVEVGGDANGNGIPEKDDGSDVVSCTVAPF